MSSSQPELTAATAEVEKRGIRVSWDRHSEHFFPWFWLRNSCHCQLCGDSLSGHRQLHPSDVPIDIEPRSVSSDVDTLDIRWQPDGHHSRYRFDWLLDFAAENSDRDWHPRLWDASLDPACLTHDLEAVRNSASRRLPLMRDLRDSGMAILRGGDAIGIQAIAAMIGDIADAAYGNVFEIKPQKKAQTQGNSTLAVPPHTDEAYLHTPTGILLLYCIRPASDGGESVLVDGFEVARQLREQDPEAYETLSRIPQAYHRIVPRDGLDYRTRSPALRVDEHNNPVGLRFHPRSMAPYDVDADAAARLHHANHAFCQLMMRAENQLCFRLEAGEAVFFDNHRVLHSRKAFEDPARHLQICNIAREQFHLKLRLLLREQGYFDELRLKLPCGVTG